MSDSEDATQPLHGPRAPELDWREHMMAARCKRVIPVGFDGANFNIANINASGALLVSGVTFTGIVNMQATVNVAGSTTLFAVVNTSAAAGVTAFIAGSVTLFSVVNVGAAGTLTAAIASSVTLNAQVNTQVTVNVAQGATIGIGNSTVTAFVAGIALGSTVSSLVNTQVTVNVASGATIGVGNSTVTAFNREVRLDHAAFAFATAMGFPMGGCVRDGVASELDQGDFGVARLNVNRAQAVVIEDGFTKARYASVNTSAELLVGISSTVTVALGLPATVPVSVASTVTITPSATITVLPGAAFFYTTAAGVTTGSGAGAAVDMTLGPCGSFGLNVEKVSGTVSAYNIDVQGAMESTGGWFSVLNNTSASGADSMVWTSTNKPVRFMRYNVTSITGANGICRLRLLAIRFQ